MFNVIAHSYITWNHEQNISKVRPIKKMSEMMKQLKRNTLRGRGSNEGWSWEGVEYEIRAVDTGHCSLCVQGVPRNMTVGE